MQVNTARVNRSQYYKINCYYETIIMDGQFITNTDLILSEIINSILQKCDNAYFLVGYFYFSGFAELCDRLKDVNLKVVELGNLK